jgi:hypothetical protein
MRFFASCVSSDRRRSLPDRRLWSCDALPDRRGDLAGGSTGSVLLLCELTALEAFRSSNDFINSFRASDRFLATDHKRSLILGSNIVATIRSLKGMKCYENCSKFRKKLTENFRGQPFASADLQLLYVGHVLSYWS